jgi:AcrR family transcriptional regulator
MGHYFGNRQTLIAAILSQSASEGAGHLERAATPDGPFDLSIPQLVGQIAMGLERGVLDLQVIGLGEGFADTGVASAYLGHHLDPIIAAVARRLDAHVAAGEMLEVDTRHAALGLVAPLLLAFLHQHALGGAGSAPLELHALAEAHAAAFVRAYARRTATAP